MKEFKGTNKPWHFVEYPGFLEIQDGESYSDNNILDVDKVGRQIAEANANLIASAPDLLEACIEFVRKVECGEAKSTKSYEQMKKAISKALGEY